MSSTSEDSAAPLPPPSGPGAKSRVNSSSADRREGAQLDDVAASRPPPRKRRRIVISCTECHRRKQKCDRKLPCTNCVSRNKQASCQYESGAYPTVSRLDAVDAQSLTTTTTTPLDLTSASASSSADIALNTFGYAQGTTTTTLSFLQQLDDSAAASASSAALPPSTEYPPALNQRYKSLLRQLPPKSYISKLVPIYFRDFNWIYATLDHAHFQSQLSAFHSLPFSVLSSPSAVPHELRPFPALLFQMCAIALLTVPDEGHKDFDGLKYAGGMSFEDLAAEYSDSGVQVLQVLGKRGMSLNTVLAGFLRGSYLKYSGLVTESWHAVQEAVRDGMEVGLHRGPREGDIGRRVWMTLVVWDVHMACVLGRPTTIGLDVVDQVKLPSEEGKGNNGAGLPTPLGRALYQFRAIRLMRDILELEKLGANGPRERVDQLHGELQDIWREIPGWLRLKDPDRAWDDHPECAWLPAARVLMSQVLSFELMALHRPYVFTRTDSRKEALKASLEMLDAQRLHFALLKRNMYKTFSLFFGTFDAVVLMTTIYILFPKEHPDLLQPALQHFQWAVERFEAMSGRNPLAKAALGVLHAIRLRLDRSLGERAKPSPASEPASTGSSGNAWDDTPPTSLDPSPGPPSTGRLAEERHTSSFSATEYPPSSSQHPSIDGAAPEDAGDFNWSLPTDFDWASVQPIFATGDLIYGNLSGTAAAGADALSGTNGGQNITTAWGDGLTQGEWQFEGDFGSDSVWSLFNNFPSAV